MPPVNQGSRAALVTWTVITSILFVTATIFAIYFYVDANKVADTSRTLSNQYTDVIDTAGLNGATVANLRDARQSASAENSPIPGINSSEKLLDVAITQRDYLAGLIAGSANSSPDKAANAAKAAVINAGKAVKAGGGTVTGNTLIDAINALSSTLNARQQEVNGLKKDLAGANEALQRKITETDQQVAEMNKTIASIRAEQEKAVGGVTDVTSSKDEQIKAIQAQADQQAKDAQDAQLKLQTQIADGTRKIMQLNQQIAALQNKLGQTRIDTNKAITRQADGTIVRVPGGNVCFIDLGQGDQISPGLTFEVYDKVEGIPAIGDPSTDENLPKGKASIEVIRVGPTSSECRITNQTPGTAISEGDLIVNLVYDKNTKYKFMVFGNFDLAHTDKPNAEDTEVIKRLITQWGGQVVNQINADTDFLILGAEPQIPTFTKDELNDPVNKAKFDQASADADAYNKVKEDAINLRIPILNQNRFLYFVGYYDQAKR